MATRRSNKWPSLLTNNGRGIAFGGDYNPDQWPEAVVDEDIRLMCQAHVNTVALAIFSWDKIEPREGAFTFEWLDRVIDKLGKAGIAVDLATATASAPMWLYIKHPEVLPIDKYGHTVNPGSRQSWQPTSPVFTAYALTLCRKLAEHYRDNPYVTAWHVGNEYGWNNRYDYSDNALDAFRAWCRARYGDIDALNEAWGTAFWSQHVNDWDEVLLPRHMGGDAMVNPAQRLDYERFGNDMLLDFFKAERDAIAELCPDKPFTTNFMVSTDQCTMDYAQWAREVDFVSNDHYFHEGESHLDELACSDALMDSLSDGRPWYVMEHSTSAVQWKPLNTRKRAGELVRDSLAHVAMGADAINFFQWRQSSSGAETFHSAMVPHAGADSKVFRGVCELGEALETLFRAGVQGTELRRASTAILFSAESEWATRSQTLPSMKLSHWHEVRDWYRGLLDAGRRADVVPLAYDWSGYKTIILPTVLVLSERDVRRIADFVRAGGNVVVGYATGLIDEHFHAGLGGYPGAGDGLLRDMLGVRSEEFNILGTEAEGEPATIGLSNGLETRLWQNDVTSTAPDTTIMATYAGDAASDWELDGVPAITSHPYGQGAAIYVGCDLDRHAIGRLAAVVDGMPWFGERACVEPGDCGDAAGPTAVTANAVPSEDAAGANVPDPRILHTVRESSDGAVRFDFYMNRAKESVTIHDVPGEPIIAHRCAPCPSGSAGDIADGIDITGATGGCLLRRNAILVTRTVRRQE